MKNEKEKKGLFSKLIDMSKPKQNSCCCGFEIEEIPEEEEAKKADKKNENKND